MIPTSDKFDTMMVAAIASFVVSMLIVLTQGWHGKHSFDKDITSIQKFHTRPVPRVGGIALFIGILAVLIFDTFDYPYLARQSYANGVFKLLIAGLPALVVGLAEDLTKTVSIKARLLATFASALLACSLLGASLPRLDILGIDDLLHLLPIALLITTIAVAGVANSINIIDGFHGVAGSAVVIMLIGMGLLSWQAGDTFVTELALAGIGATLGFLLVNYPTGRIFMGDGGAYFAGFWVAEVAVLTIARNPSVNAWQVLAICAYPVIEVLYSVYRRRVIRKASPGAPDRLHLHTLIYRRIVCQLVPRNKTQPWIRNASVTCVLASWFATITLISVWVGDTIPAAISVVIGQVVIYMAVYRRLVRGHWCLNQADFFGLRPDGGTKSS